MKPQTPSHRPLILSEIEAVIANPLREGGSIAMFKLTIGPCVSFRCPECMRKELANDHHFLTSVANGVFAIHAVHHTEYEHGMAGCSGCDRDLSDFEITEFNNGPQKTGDAHYAAHAHHS